MIHEILPVGMLACNCSIFGDETTAKPWSSILATTSRRFCAWWRVTN